MARFTLQEIEASVLLQDGLWGAAGVTRHVFLCGGGKTVISTAVLTGVQTLSELMENACKTKVLI